MSSDVQITVNLELDPWVDITPPPLNRGADGDLTPARLERIGLLPAGTLEGRPTVALLVRLPDGQQLVVETTWRLFLNATNVLAHTPVAQMEHL